VGIAVFAWASALLPAQSGNPTSHEPLTERERAMLDKIEIREKQSGRVTGWINLRALMSTASRLDSEAVLNGFAYDAVERRGIDR
jgi:hypothetical protein